MFVACCFVFGRCFCFGCQSITRLWRGGKLIGQLRVTRDWQVTRFLRYRATRWMSLWSTKSDSEEGNVFWKSMKTLNKSLDKASLLKRYGWRGQLLVAINLSSSIAVSSTSDSQLFHFTWGWHTADEVSQRLSYKLFRIHRSYEQWNMCLIARWWRANYELCSVNSKTFSNKYVDKVRIELRDESWTIF